MLSGSYALRLSRLSRQALDNKQGPRIQCFLRKAIRRIKASNPKKATKKRKRPNPPNPDDSVGWSDDHVSDPIENTDSQESNADGDLDWSMNLGRSSRPKKKHQQDIMDHSSEGVAVGTEVIELSSD